MIDPALFAQWVLAIGVIILTPGPDTLLIMRNSANSGRVAGFATLAGVQLGIVFHTTLVLVGVTAFLAGQPALILLIGIGGAIFIVYLAWQTWTAGFVGGDLREGKLTTPTRALFDALITNALNPKVILAFFAIMLPLISPELPEVPQVLLMAAAALFMNVLWQGALVVGAEWFFRVLTDPAAQKWINRVVALILLVLAVLLPFQAVDKVRSLQTGQDSSQPSSAQISGSAEN